jgi:RNA polymerase sigma factor (sigma-70 family)
MHPVDEWLAGTGDLIAVGTAEPLPDVAVTDKETRASIDAAIAGLDPVERRVIVLAYDEGLTQSEIATSLGWPIGTVKTRTRRALRHLREQMTPLVAPATSFAPPPVPCPAPCL